MTAGRVARGLVRRARERASFLPRLVRNTPPWRAARAELRRRGTVGERELVAARRSDTVFVFGSGASLNELTASEWDRIAKHDTFGFNWFVRQRFVRCDFHLIRQIADANDRRIAEPQIREYCDLLATSPEFEDTIVLLQHERRALGANLALAWGLLPPPRRVFPWRTSRGANPSPSFEDGLSHAGSTLCDTVNAAYLMGWNRIVLVGVDLYDRRYFWLSEGETRSVDRMRRASFDAPHTQATGVLAGVLARWAEHLAAEGVLLEVYNPRSLLAGTLPVFDGTPAG